LGSNYGGILRLEIGIITAIDNAFGILFFGSRFNYGVILRLEIGIITAIDNAFGILFFGSRFFND
jgi:hypothetical protein